MKKKLNIIKNKIQSLEKSLMKIESKINYERLKNNLPDNFNKIHQSKIKYLKLEYISQIKSLSLILLTLQKIN